MSYELVINSAVDGVQIALLRDKKLLEYHEEKTNRQHSVGDIYLGVVKRTLPGHNAAFVDVGYVKDAFLHYLDLGPQIRNLLKYAEQAKQGGFSSAFPQDFKVEPDIEKTGKINQVLQKGKNILVQVSKEPISTKGPRLTSELSIPGTFCVLTPFGKTVSVSKKIKTNEERMRLKKIAEELKPKNFGLIVRTVAEDRTREELHRDIIELEKKWENIYNQLRFAKAPLKLHGEEDRSLTIIRDLLSSDFSSIVVDDENLYNELKNYLSATHKGKEKILRYHNSKTPVFEQYEIDKKIQTAFGKNVPVSGGAYLVVEHTEALHVIDVNSGSKSNADDNQEQNAVTVNMEAAAEIARQLRLRDMGGIIVCDFIDMRNPVNKKNIYQKLREEMESDRAKHTILPMSKFGLIEITRQRVRPEMVVGVTELCPMCEGTGEVRQSFVMLDKVEKNLSHLSTELNIKKLTLVVHPFVEAYMKQGFWNSLRRTWMKKYNCKLKVEGEKHFHLGQYKFLNQFGEEVEVE